MTGEEIAKVRFFNIKFNQEELCYLKSFAKSCDKIDSKGESIASQLSNIATELLRNGNATTSTVTVEPERF